MSSIAIETNAVQVVNLAPHLADLNLAIERASELLPSQGPITAFVFLNTLQALEDLPFDEGLAKGARLFGCQPYLTEDRYRMKLELGRIRQEDLAAVVEEDLAELADGFLGSLGPRFHLRLAMLRFPLRFGPAEELRWFVAETDALRKIREEVPLTQRDRFIEETRRWVLRELDELKNPPRSQHTADDIQTRRSGALLNDLVSKIDGRSPEDWSSTVWESLSLQVLWRICREGVHGLKVHHAPAMAPLRLRDQLLETHGEDSDALVHEILIRFCAAFVDQGFADWELPNRQLGFYKAFFSLYGQSGGPPDRWLAGLPQEIARLEKNEIGPIESIDESLNLLGVAPDERADYVTASLLALRGWAGLIRQLEVRGDRVALPVPTGTTTEYLAVRLILERLALTHVAKSVGIVAPLSDLREAVPRVHLKHDTTSIEQRAFYVFQLSQVLGWSPPTLFRLTKQEWNTLIHEIESFSSLERRRVLHQAFERRLRLQALDALTIHTQREPQRVTSPRFQAVFCIDAREESFRRHLEELSPDVETFGAAGFYSVAMYYRGVADAHYATLCPIVIRPQHWVVEEVVYSLEQANRRRAKTRKAIGTASHQVHLGSRSIAAGALLTAGVGVLASIPLVARVLFPRLTSQIRKMIGTLVEPPPVTRLRLDRIAPKAGPADDQIGFSIDERANIGERLLRDIGLTSSFARLVMFFGHGSFCLNNPHKSAYDCGACSGGAGGPNARALAAMLNDYRVRAILAERGLAIPAETIFLGGLHNTCADSLTFFDLDQLPKSHHADFEAARETLEQTCERNAHERCRRFQSAPLNLTYAAARWHVEERSEDLAQTRPEFGNASNAVCFVGRRAFTRDLYLDRRCFMHSYDPTQDDDKHSILARILGAVVPVCSGINLQYFFSAIDSPGWGSGTKLPHNITSLLGVMDGAASDLRTGLPWQGVEIHEPVRLLFVIETTPAGILSIMDANPMVGRILKNGWAQLALRHPDTGEMLDYRDGEFQRYRPEVTQIPHTVSSIEWYRNRRDHLPFAAIVSDRHV